MAKIRMSPQSYAAQLPDYYDSIINRIPSNISAKKRARIIKSINASFQGMPGTVPDDEINNLFPEKLNPLEEYRMSQLPFMQKKFRQQRLGSTIPNIANLFKDIRLGTKI